MSELDGTEWERKQKELFRSAMVKAREKGYDRWAAVIYAEYYMQGIAEERLRTLQALIQAGFCLEDKAMVALGVTEEEYAEAKESLSATV